MHARALFLALLPALGCSIPPTPAPAVHFLVEGREVPIQHVQVFSVDNENQTFYVSFEADAGEIPIGTELAALHLAEQVLPITSASFSPVMSSYGLRVDAVTARRLAQALSVPARTRTHPGHELAARFEILGEITAGTDTLPVRFVLHNQGDVAIQFLTGGRYRNESGRDNRFKFQIERDGETLPDIGSPYDFGGLGFHVTLEPGEEHTIEVDLAHWADFDRAGTYHVRGTYEIDLRHSEYDVHAPPYRDAHLQWDEVAEAGFDLRVTE